MLLRGDEEIEFLCSSYTREKEIERDDFSDHS